ncbi:uncharacterized protein LOC135385592 [Ornithodoros turicata]|uniref:uncharacterized protein LOC135385592 n=1 Tax=Ornithodoros turicata TaxID=34597 RepID=UPI00313A1033
MRVLYWNLWLANTVNNYVEHNSECVRCSVPLFSSFGVESLVRITDEFMQAVGPCVCILWRTFKRMHTTPMYTASRMCKVPGVSTTTKSKAQTRRRLLGLSAIKLLPHLTIYIQCQGWPS